MRGRTMVISLLVHGVLAASLLGAATRRAARRPTSVSLAEVKKTEKPRPRPPSPVAPPPSVARKVASLPRPGPAPVPVARAPSVAPAPVATALTLSNDDGPGGIALPTRGPAGAAAPVTKVASAITEARRKRMQEAATGAGAAEEAPCTEEATKPEPVFKQEIEYTAQARTEGIEGKLKLRLTVGPDGAVARVDVLDSVSPELDAAAIAAAKLWRFKPAAACGRPTTGSYVLARRFELGD